MMAVKIYVLQRVKFFHNVKKNFKNFRARADSMDSSPQRRNRGRPKAWDDKTEQNTIKSLDRAMEVLEHLSTLPGVTLSELSSDLNQSTATVYRILVTLEGRGLVELDAENQVWHVGPQAFLIGAQYLRRTSIVDRARPILRRLMEETGETANLAVPRDGHVMFVGQVECNQSVRAFFPPGTMSPMHASGIGKALLAAMPERSLDVHLGANTLTRFTEHTITDADHLKHALSDIRAAGYAIDEQEKNLGMRCIAAAVYDWNGDAVAGLSVSGPINRVTEAELSKLAASVTEAAATLSKALGATMQ
jgi:IclR family acetate operon transcriptional repressor